MLVYRLTRFKSLQHQWEGYLTDMEQEREELERERANLQEKEDEIRERLQEEYDKKEKELQESRDELAAERRDWEEEKERVKQTKVFEKVVTLDVGGTKYRTTLSTLTKYPDSMLGAMFSGRHNLPQQEDGSYFIDRDGQAFSIIMTYLRDRDLCFGELDVTGPSAKTENATSQEKMMVLNSWFDARYYQLAELETKVRLAFEGNPEWTDSISYSSKSYYGQEKTAKFEMDYGSSTLECRYHCEQTKSISFHRITNRFFSNTAGKGIEYQEKITFESCNLSDMHFRNCYFQKGVSFEGCILHGTKFERVGGLVSHKVHFAPWQVAQADFEPELLQALKDNGCIY